MSIVSEPLDAATWWDTIQDRVDTPLHDLVDGFDDIAHQALPYNWLPPRARTIFGSNLTWAELAKETMHSLATRPPRAGLTVVRALVTTARDTAAAAGSAPTGHPEDPQTAIRRMLKRLSHHDYELLAARGWALRPASIPVTARQLGVSAVHVQRHTPRAYARLHDLLAEPAHAVIGDYASTLRARLGSLTQEPTARSELNDLGLDIATDPGQLLLHLAGPFTPNGTWLESATGPTLVAALAALDAVVAEHKAPTTATLQAALTHHLQVAAPIATKVIDIHPILHRFGDQWVHWGSDNADKVQAVLHLLGKPATPADIAAIAGDVLTEQSTRNAFGNDPRFTRATKQTWGLREWGLREYTGVYAEISARLEAVGQPVSVTAIVDDIRAALPDVAESTIRTYLSAPGFIINEGMIRHRRDGDGWPKVAPINTIRGAFHDGAAIRYAVPVTTEVLRGSGVTVSGAVATALGVTPGQQRTFTGPQSELTLTWLLSVTNGASFGSLRELATTLGADLDDTIVLAFTPDDGTVTATRIPAGADTMTRLRTLVGRRQVRSPIVTLVRSLRCSPGEVAALLARRGENDLLTLLRESDS